MELTLARPAPIAAAEFTARRTRAAELCGQHGLDGLLVWGMGGSTLDGFADVFYLSNHYSVEPKTPDVEGAWTGFGRAAVVLPASGPATLLTGPPNWRADLVAIDRVESDRDLYGLVSATLSASGLGRGRIGMVRDDAIPMALVRRLERELPGAALVPAGELLAGMRMIKSPAEVALMRHASRVGAAVIGEMLEVADAGATDGDLAAAGYAAATRYGATPYDFAMASGPQSANAYWCRLPTFDPFRRYERGDMVHPDVFGCVDGYFYDLQRSTVAGAAPTATQEAVLDGAVDLVHHVCAALRPGTRARDVFAAGMEWRRENGWLGSAGTSDLDTWPAFGHGIGLCWEGPWLTADDDTELAPGMVVAVESYCSHKDATAVHEEAVLVTGGEPEILTAACPARPWR